MVPGYQTLPKLHHFRTNAIVEGQQIGHGLSLNEARFGVWENDVTIITEIDGADLDVLVKRGNPTCEDIGQEEPMLNYLRFLAI